MSSIYPDPVEIGPTWKSETLAVQAGRPRRLPGAPMNPSITLSSTYIHDTDVSYGRDGNDGWGALENAMGTLDGGHAITFATGLAAATAIAELVPTGGKVVIPKAAYYGVSNLFRRMQEHQRLQIELVDSEDISAVIAASTTASMVWLESVANPLMVVANIPTIATAAKQSGALVVVDATFVTPLRQKPLQLGADIVLHSATKLIGGHSDLLLGVAVCKEQDHAQFLNAFRHDHGSIPGNLETFLALRGLRSLSVRLDRAQQNAMEIAHRLQQHPKVTKVNYPGLVNDPQFATAARVLPLGSGNMLSFELDASAQETDEILSNLKLISHATSLGGVESAIERRTRWSAEADAGVPMTLCRFSVGIENCDDLWEDLSNGIHRILGS